MRGGYRVRGGGGGASGPAGFSDSFGLNFIVADSNAVPTDAPTFQINLLTGDTNADLTDTFGLRIEGLGDSNVVPTDSKIFSMRIWLSGSVVGSTNGVTNVTNQDGQNDGTITTYQSAALGDANPRTTAVLGANIPAGVTVTSAIYRGWFKSVNTLITSAGRLQISGSVGTQTMFVNTALNTTIDHLAGTFTYDLVANGWNTAAKLQTIIIPFDSSDAVAGVTPHVLTVDAGCIELAGAFV